MRPAVADDEGAVQVLVAAFVSSFRYDGEAFAVTWPRLLGAPDAVVLVAEGETGVVGYLLALVHDTFYAGGPVAWVEEVMVDAGHRGTGVGRALMHEAERWAAQRHARLVALASRRAGPFYETLGYEAGATFYRRVLRPDDAAGSQA